MRKEHYMLKVLHSCRNIEQLDACSDWALRINKNCSVTEIVVRRLRRLFVLFKNFKGFNND